MRGHVSSCRVGTPCSFITSAVWSYEAASRRGYAFELVPVGTVHSQGVNGGTFVTTVDNSTYEL